MKKKHEATLSLDDPAQTIHLDTHMDCFSRSFVDISTLFKTHGLCTMDPGLQSTAICQSAITFIDGEKGILRYRGYPIEQLAEKHDFTDVIHLLLYGEIPTQTERNTLRDRLNAASLNTSFQEALQTFSTARPDAHPMGMLLTYAAELSALYEDAFDYHKADDRERAAIHLIAHIPLIAAHIYRQRYTQNKTIPPTSEPQPYAAHFLSLLPPRPNQSDQSAAIHQTFVKALDAILTLHADHEQNASTFSVRAVASTGSNPFACLCAGLAALWGPAHGGANEASLNMLQTIGHEKNIEPFLKRAKDPNDPFRLMGFGHRVYKNEDPRANIMRSICAEVLGVLDKQEDPLFHLAKNLERIAREDPYFIQRKLYPNVDFYSGIVLKAMEIPTQMFTVLFAMARTTGWMAHWLEMTANAYNITRPRQIYIGHPKRTL